jgi:hypothetical protein
LLQQAVGLAFEIKDTLDVNKTEDTYSDSEECELLEEALEHANHLVNSLESIDG